MDSTALSEGQVFAHRYRISRCVAAGGMGAVYEAFHTETDRRVALKVMLPHFVSNSELRDRFKREARITANIDSEFIVEVLDAGVDEQTEMPFLVMEYLEGQDLSGEIESKGPLPADLVVTYLHQAALALHKTHTASIVHRDLKPENLFLTRRDDGSPRIRILDFGISKVVEAARTNATQTLGTPLYMAPEQFDGKVSPACDIYALGMIAYTLLVGQAYWQPDEEEEASVFVLAGRVMRGVQDPASQYAQKRGVKLPPAFDAWFAKACNRDPKLRHAGAIELVQSLADACGVASPARPQALSLSPEEALPRAERQAPAATDMALATDASTTGVRPHKRVMPLVLGGGVLAVAAIGTALFFASRHEPSSSGLVQPEPPADSPVVSAPTVPPSTTAPASVVVAPDAPPAASIASAPPATGTAPPVTGRKDLTTRDKKNAKADATAKPEATSTAAPAQPASTGGVYSRF